MKLTISQIPEVNPILSCPMSSTFASSRDFWWRITNAWQD